MPYVIGIISSNFVFSLIYLTLEQNKFLLL